MQLTGVTLLFSSRTSVVLKLLLWHLEYYLRRKINIETDLDVIYDYTLLAESTVACIFLPVSMNKYTLKNRVHHIFDFILVFL